MAFYFTDDKNFIINSIKSAEKFIKIIAFQFTSEEFVKYLIEKSKSGIEIELITLPEDSYSKEEERNKISAYYKSLKDNGVKIYLCDWEVGDPSLTSTSMSGDLKEGGGNKWYSLHGKLMITENDAIIMSLNFTDQKLLEVYLSYNKKELIDQLLEKYQKCKNLFTDKTSFQGINGTLINLLDKNNQDFVLKGYESSKKKLVKQYSPDITPEISISSGLFISPFEGRLRKILYNLIDGSNDFLYISSERLFDSNFVKFIGNKIINSNNLDVKVLTSPPGVVRQNIEKATNQFRQIEVFGGKIKAIENLHAKFWLNEKYLIVTSANLTKMNLGFKKKGNYWRANTEFFYIEDNPKIIELAKKEFENRFKIADDINSVLGTSTKAQTKAKEYFDLFDYSSRKEAKIILGKFRLKLTIDTERNLIKIARFSSILAKNEGTKFIEKKHVIMGGILLYLQKRESTLKELYEILSGICPKSEIESNVQELINKKIIESEKETYKINIEYLLGKKIDDYL